MGYESLSTVIVLAIVMILMVIWLPKRTVNGMKKVIEHREDRFSPSLHLVDADSGTRFSDETALQAKGAIMQSEETHKDKLSKEHIAQVRALRRAAMRRRRAIAATLAVLTVVVFVCAFALHFSPLFALIPAVLLAAVLAMGVRAAKQAMAWEQKVARYRAKQRKKAATARKRAEAEQSERDRLRKAELEEARRIAQAQVSTDVISEGEIRQAIAQGKADRDAVMNRRAEASARNAAEAMRSAGDSAAEVRNEAVASGLSVHDERDGAAGNEMVPAESVDDSVLAAASQDLISFSLGEARNGDDIMQDAPESMEIKSTRQVAKAVPVKAQAGVEPLIVPSNAMSSMDSDEAAARVDAGVQLDDVDVVEFHSSEVSADVDVPDASSDSLGTGLEAILARRSA